jgi:DNA mismatch repair protein MSH6
MLRNILPSNTLWQSFRDGREFYSADETLKRLSEIFETTDDDGSTAKLMLPEAIEGMLDTPIAMEALGGMLFYLNSLNLDKDLISQKNFNIYDPLKEGKNLLLDGVTLGHMEVGHSPRNVTGGDLISRCWSTTKAALRGHCWTYCKCARHRRVSLRLR